MNQRKCSVAYYQQRIGEVLCNQITEGFSVHGKQDWVENRPLRDTE